MRNKNEILYYKYFNFVLRLVISRSSEPEIGIYFRLEPVCYPPSQIQLYFVFLNKDVKNLVAFDYINNLFLA